VSLCLCVGLSVQELSDENDELSEQIKELRRRTAMLRILIEELEQTETRYGDVEDPH